MKEYPSLAEACGKEPIRLKQVKSGIFGKQISDELYPLKGVVDDYYWLYVNREGELVYSQNIRYPDSHLIRPFQSIVGEFRLIGGHYRQKDGETFNSSVGGGDYSVMIMDYFLLWTYGADVITHSYSDFSIANKKTKDEIVHSIKEYMKSLVSEANS